MAPAETPDAVARFPCAPGGNSTFVMGADSSGDVVSSGRVAPGGESTLVLGADASYDAAAVTSTRGAVGGKTIVFLGRPMPGGGLGFGSCGGQGGGRGLGSWVWGGASISRTGGGRGRYKPNRCGGVGMG